MPTVTVTSKPQHIGALRKTWRSSAQHAAEQLTRFLRLTVLAALPSAVNLIQGGHFDRRTLLAFILPFVEVAYRQVFPALGAAAADAAPGVTIVPAEVTPASNSDAGHADATLLALFAVITAGVFLGGWLLHIALT